MKQVLHHIQSGQFAQDWMNEDKKGRKNYHALLKKGEEHPIETVGKRLRKNRKK